MKIFLIVFGILFLFSCNQVNENYTGIKDSLQGIANAEELVIEDQSDSTLIKLSKKIWIHIKNEDYVALSQYFNPEIKVRFSPYSYVNIKTDIEIAKENFVNELKNTRSWGSYDGSGEPIIMDTYKYFEEFVFDPCLPESHEISVNKTTHRGNTLHNVNEIYKDCNFVELYCPGSNPEFSGLDWKALTLVFKFVDGKNYLVAIIHDQWTI